MKHLPYYMLQRSKYAVNLTLWLLDAYFGTLVHTITISNCNTSTLWVSILLIGNRFSTFGSTMLTHFLRKLITGSIFFIVYNKYSSYLSFQLLEFLFSYFSSFSKDSFSLFSYVSAGSSPNERTLTPSLSTFFMMKLGWLSINPVSYTHLTLPTTAYV